MRRAPRLVRTVLVARARGHRRPVRSARAVRPVGGRGEANHRRWAIVARNTREGARRRMAILRLGDTLCFPSASLRYRSAAERGLARANCPEARYRAARARGCLSDGLPPSRLHGRARLQRSRARSSVAWCRSARLRSARRGRLRGEGTVAPDARIQSRGRGPARSEAEREREPPSTTDARAHVTTVPQPASRSQEPIGEERGSFLRLRRDALPRAIRSTVPFFDRLAERWGRRAPRVTDPRRSRRAARALSPFRGARRAPHEAASPPRGDRLLSARERASCRRGGGARIAR